MKPVHFQLIRVFLGVLLAVLVSFESPLWWIAAAPWAALCFLGLIATLPIVLVIGIGAGTAQADWMSDTFAIGLVIVTPTTLAVTISAWTDRSRTARADARAAPR